jgi:hypothetical protein
MIKADRLTFLWESPINGVASPPELGLVAAAGCGAQRAAQSAPQRSQSSTSLQRRPTYARALHSSDFLHGCSTQRHEAVAARVELKQKRRHAKQRCDDESDVIAFINVGWRGLTCPRHTPDNAICRKTCLHPNRRWIKQRSLRCLRSGSSCAPASNSLRGAKRPSQI